jgi:hypothetical protein
MKAAVCFFISAILTPLSAADPLTVTQRVQLAALASASQRPGGEYVIRHDDKFYNPEDPSDRGGLTFKLGTVYGRPFLIRKSAYIIVGAKRIFTIGFSQSKPLGLVWSLKIAPK